jgi:hypothetical protein
VRDVTVNNFTKDELQIILLDMDINIKKAPPLKPSPIYIELRNKVELMIDNYCEHESDGLNYLSYPPQSRCKKCGEYYR